MMEVIASKISVPEIIPYIISSKNCYVNGSSYVLQPRNGSLVLDFSKTIAMVCSINFKRESGNGLMTSNCSGRNLEHQILSQVSNEIAFNLDKTKRIYLHRTNRSSGNVSISYLSLFNDSKRIDWNDELKKCDKHFGLKLMNDQLFATSDSFIIGGEVEIQTNPPNMISKTDSAIRFLGNCQIIALSIEKKTTVAIDNSKIIYDTMAVGFNPMYCTKAIASVNNLIIEHRGSYTVPLSSIKSDCKYTIIVYASLIDGNGKMTFGVLPGNDFSHTVIVNNASQPFSRQITPNLGLQQYSLFICRDHSAKGKINISRIIVKEDVDQSSIVIPNIIERVNNTSIIIDQVIKEEEAILDIKRPTMNSSIPTASVPKPIVISSNTIDKDIVSAFFQFAILGKDRSEVPNKINRTGTFELTDFKSRLWYNRIRNCFTDFEYTNRYNVPAYHNDIQSKRIPNIQIGSINTISKNNKVFINYIDNSTELSPDNIEVLSNCSTILTPSIYDMFKIKSSVPNANVLTCYLPWPFIRGDYITKNYYLYFEESRELTNKLISVWNAAKGPLYIVGSTCASLSWIKNISFALDYIEIVKFIAESKGIIYLSSNTQHYSGMLELAKACNINIASNNHKYIQDSIIRNEQQETSANDIKITLDSFFKKEAGGFCIKEDVYLDKVNHQMDILLG